MRAQPHLRGVPAAGHVTSGGAWHPGGIPGCAKCGPPPSVKPIVYRNPGGEHDGHEVTITGEAARKFVVRCKRDGARFSVLWRDLEGLPLRQEQQ